MWSGQSTASVARANFARFHNLPTEKVTLADVANSSEGIGGWAMKSSAPFVTSSTAAAAARAAASRGSASASALPTRQGLAQGKAKAKAKAKAVVVAARSSGPGGTLRLRAGGAGGGAGGAIGAGCAGAGAPRDVASRGGKPMPSSRPAISMAAAAAMTAAPPAQRPGGLVVLRRASAAASAAAAAGAREAARAAEEAAPRASKPLLSSAPTLAPAHREPLGDITNAGAGAAGAAAVATPDAGKAASGEAPDEATCSARSDSSSCTSCGGSPICRRSRLESGEECWESGASVETQAEASRELLARQAMLDAEYGAGIWRQMQRREGEFRINPAFMDGQAEVTPRMRMIANDWLIDVHKKYQHRRETLFLAIQVMDSYLVKHQVKRDRLQLVGACATLVAAKFEEVEPLKVHDLIYVMVNGYSQDDIIIMENSIILALDFRIAMPTAAHFLAHLLAVARKHRQQLAAAAAASTAEEGRAAHYDPMHPEFGVGGGGGRRSEAASVDSEPRSVASSAAWQEREEGQVEQVAWFLLELSCLAVEALGFEPSRLAASAALLATQLFPRTAPAAPPAANLGDGEEAWPLLLAQLTGYGEDALKDCCAFLMRLLEGARDSPLAGVRKRFPHRLLEATQPAVASVPTAPSPAPSPAPPPATAAAPVQAAPVPSAAESVALVSALAPAPAPAAAAAPL